MIHSVITGISLGASERASTIKPLVAALSFHQFFEGTGLGGCISQVYTDAVYPTSSKSSPYNLFANNNKTHVTPTFNMILSNPVTRFYTTYNRELQIGIY